MRDRSIALVVRDGKILMEKLKYGERVFYSPPGGGIEDGETPEEAALRELQEECGLSGTIVRKLTTVEMRGGSKEIVFEVEVPKEQEAIVGYDPEGPMDAQAIQDVRWMALNEIGEKDRAFLWMYGLIGVGDFFRQIAEWGDEISYPGQDEKTE